MREDIFLAFKMQLRKALKKPSQRSPGQLMFLSHRTDNIQKQKTFEWTLSDELQEKTPRMARKKTLLRLRFDTITPERNCTWPSWNPYEHLESSAAARSKRRWVFAALSCSHGNEKELSGIHSSAILCYRVENTLTFICTEPQKM